MKTKTKLKIVKATKAIAFAVTMAVYLLLDEIEKAIETTTRRRD